MKGMRQLVGGPRDGAWVPDTGREYREAKAEKVNGRFVFRIYDAGKREADFGVCPRTYVLREETE